MTKLLLSSVTLLCLSGCAPREAATTWGYSHWYEQSSGGSMGAFEEQQKRCLDQIGVADDATSVVPDSPEENAFLECMNGAGWCTVAFDCDKPGV